MVQRLIVALILLCGLYAFIALPVASLDPVQSYRKDFLQEYTLARAVAEGEDPYQPTQVLADRYLTTLHDAATFPHPTPHPPPVAILVLPLALFDYQTAAMLWLALEVILIAASAYTAIATLGYRPTILVAAALAIALINWYPFWMELVYGQLMTLILLFATLTWWSLKHDRPRLAGLFLGMSLLIKPVLWPLGILLLAKRQYRIMAWTSLTVVAGYVAAVATIGLSSTITYFTEVLPAIDRAYHGYVWNGSLLTIGWKLFDGTYSTVLEGTTAPPLYRLETAPMVTSALLIVAACIFSGLYVKRCGDLGACIGVMLCVSILISPISWPHYQTLAFLPLMYTAHRLANLGLPSFETGVAVATGILLAASSREWLKVGAWLAGQPTTGALPSELPFAPALLAMMPTVAVIALTFLVARLGTRHAVDALN